METSPLLMPHLLWHGPIAYNGHVRGAVTLTPVADRLTVELLLSILTILVRPDRVSNPYLLYARQTLYLNPTQRWAEPIKDVYVIHRVQLLIVRFEHVKQCAIGSCYDPYHFGTILINVRYESCTVIIFM